MHVLESEPVDDGHVVYTPDVGRRRERLLDAAVECVRGVPGTHHRRGVRRALDGDLAIAPKQAPPPRSHTLRRGVAHARAAAAHAVVGRPTHERKSFADLMQILARRARRRPAHQRQEVERRRTRDDEAAHGGSVRASGNHGDETIAVSVQVGCVRRCRCGAKSTPFILSQSHSPFAPAGVSSWREHRRANPCGPFVDSPNAVV